MARAGMHANSTWRPQGRVGMQGGAKQVRRDQSCPAVRGPAKGEERADGGPGSPEIPNDWGSQIVAR